MLNKTFLFILAMTLLGIIGIVTVNLALDRGKSVDGLFPPFGGAGVPR